MVLTVPDEQILDFYIQNKADNTELFRRYTKEKELKSLPQFLEAKGFIESYRGEILQQMRKKIIGKSKMEENPR